MTDRAHLAFTLALHRALAPDPTDDVCWSPFSVASAVRLVAAGAAGMTRDELVVLLLGDKSGDIQALGRLLDEAATLAPAGRDEQEPVLAVSNTMWADASLRLREDFVDEVARTAGGSVQPAPFSTDPGAARKLINNDVAETTRGLIPNLVPDGAIRKDTRAALVNALYLKCGWRHRFAEEATVPGPFRVPGGTIEVPTMELTESVGYAARDGWQVIGLPAVGGVEATVLLPDGDLAETESWLDASMLADLIDAQRSTQVRLRLPKLDLSTQAELTPALNERSVRTVFTDDADLSGISPDSLAVQAVLHQSVLKLDEQGLEGAAATAIMFRLTGISMEQPVEVHVDRPFLLLVRHAATGVVYFAARVVTPG
ncbi:MAG TPA: serpin family protein [Actinophytocola sp.]|uniref:serpin family protein n=1 Tax=Actinophytocola sp. TaxID=1872138 RepID=UPI002DDD11C8|nr:serpin family protein [Actinophytocola sp.]HEV2782586.1 serpin family protein [Actinophytocola sp.]